MRGGPRKYPDKPCLRCGVTVPRGPNYKGRKYCSIACAKLASRVDHEDFWAKVHKGERCWIWMGTKHRYGYGACAKRYGDTRAHRAAWKYINGPIPEGKVLCHKCDNKLCVNPFHLFVGTQKDNMADNKAKGKSSYGERSWNAKLTDALVLEIRGLKGTATQLEIAGRYGMSQASIGHIMSGRTWKHLSHGEGAWR